MSAIVPIFHDGKARLLEFAPADATINPLAVSIDDLIRWIALKDPVAVGSWRELSSEEYTRAFAAARTTGANVIGDLYREYMATIEAQGTEVDFAERVLPILRRKGWLAGTGVNVARRVQLIYDTNLRLSRAAGQWSRYQRTVRTFPYLRGVTARDERVRRPPKSDSDHNAFDGIILPVEHPFWQRWFPPLGFRCFLPQTKIEGAVVAGIRRWHAGKAVEVVMASGRRLSVTQDHPILTGRGWVIAEHVRIGDYTLRRSNKVDFSSATTVNNYDSPTSAQELFETLEAHTFAAAQRGPFELDDKTNVGQSKVDVCFVNPILADKFISEFISEQLLIRATLGADNLLGGYSEAQSAVREFDSSNARQSSDLGFANAELSSHSAHGTQGISGLRDKSRLKFGVSVSGHLPSRAALPLSASRRLFDGLPLDKLGLGTPAQDDAMFEELAAYGSSGDSGLFGELVNAYSGDVLIDEVVEVREFNFSGHVYDFQTEEGILAADGIIVHNCRCSVIQMTRSQLARWNKPITSEEELAQLEERLGTPIFASPVSFAGQLATIAAASNDKRIPGQAAFDMRSAQYGGQRVLNAAMIDAAVDDISALLNKIFGQAA